MIEFVDRRIHTSIESKKAKDVGFFGFLFFARTKRVDIDIFGGFGFKASVVDAAD